MVVLKAQDGFLLGFEHFPPEPTNRRLRKAILSGSRAISGLISETSRCLCREHGVAEPLTKVSDSWVTTAFHRPTSELGTRTGLKQESGKGQARVGQESRHQVKFLRNCLTEKAIGTLMASVSRKDRTKFRNQILKPLLQAGSLEMTIPEKPTSSQQKYRVTDKGRQLLSELRENDVLSQRMD